MSDNRARKEDPIEVRERRLRYTSDAMRSYLKTERVGATARGPDPEDNWNYLQLSKINTARLKVFAEREGLMDRWPACPTFRKEFFFRNMMVPKDGADPVVLLLMKGDKPEETQTYHETQMRCMTFEEMIRFGFIKEKRPKSPTINTHGFVEERIGATVEDEDEDEE